LHEIAERPYEQECTHQQAQGEGNLHYDQRPAQYKAFLPRACSASANLHCYARIRVRRLNCRSQAEQYAGKDCQPSGETEYPPIGREIDENAVLLRAKKCHQHSTQNLCQRSAGNRSERGEQQALGEKLANQSCARGAQGQPQCHFPLPRCCTCQHQVREVCASDQQHKP